jgi:acyl carrier protein
MAWSYSQLLAQILDLMVTLADDWEYSGDLSEETCLFGDLGFESLDLVVLGTAIQERYGRMPFAEFLAQIGQRVDQDVSVGELVSFVCSNQQAVTTGGH